MLNMKKVTAMKKITAIIIAVILILSPLQTMVFAAEPTDSVDSGETITESGTLQEPGDPGEAEDPGDMPETQAPVEPQVQGEAAAPSEPGETPSASIRQDEVLDPFMEVTMPQGMENMDFRSLEKGAALDYGPPKSISVPPLVKLTSTQEDTIEVAKTAVPSREADTSAECRVYDVQLQITGEPPQIPVDVVLVIDRSGSMAAGNPSSMHYAKQAANAFTDSVLANSNNRVAVVSYAGPTNYNTYGSDNDAKQEIGLSNNATLVKSAINGMAAPLGGTNIQAGFRRARNILSTSGRENANKVIVLLTDGVANCSSGNYPGSNEPTYHNVHTIAAYQAGQSCWDIARVFTVGLFNQVPKQTKPIAREVLQWAQNSGYYETLAAADLSAIYDQISGQLGYSATNSVVTDVVDENFELVAGSFISSPSSAEVTYDEVTQTITWEPNYISTLATLKYKVRAKAGVMGNDLPTNDSAVLNYTDLNGNNKQQTFPVPTVNVIGVDARDDLTIVVGDPEISLGEDLQVYGYEPFQYLWTNDKDPTWSSNSPNPAVQPEDDTVYTIQITDKYGCKKSDDVKVTVKKGKIKITKIVLEGVGGIDTAKEFVIHMDGPQGKMWNTFLKHQQISEISNLRPGDYQITEVVPMNYSLVSIENANVTITREMILNDQVVVVTVTNKKVNDSWFEDEDDKDNFFTVVVSSTDNQRSAAIMQSLKAVLPEREEGLEAEDETSS